MSIKKAVAILKAGNFLRLMWYIEKVKYKDGTESDEWGIEIVDTFKSKEDSEDFVQALQVLYKKAVSTSLTDANAQCLAPSTHDS